MAQPNEFLLLVAALLDDLPGQAVTDTTLVQLHSLFGPMLVAALQLVDRREVVKVVLPGGRTIHQVTSSAGAPYTLYLDLPFRPREPNVAVERKEASVEEPDKAKEKAMDVDTPEKTEGDKAEDAQASKSDSPPSTPSSTRSRLDTPSPPTPEPEPQPEAQPRDATAKDDDQEKQRRLHATAQSLASMFCPCPGFAYNSLTGERNVFCKHILAVLLVHQLGRILETQVELAAVADLVGASSMAAH